MTDFAPVSARMREDWDRRASENAPGYVYTRDHAQDDPNFLESGRLNYQQLVRPYLPVVLNGRAPRDCRMAEIGCGLGRMTAWCAEEFGFVDALDVSPVMIAQARERLGSRSNVALHVSSGCDLRPLEDASCDFLLSFIVFQHVPSREVILNYLRESGRVLEPGGALRFQFNGDPAASPELRTPDTWIGAGVTLRDLLPVLEDSGLSPIAAEAEGTQYFFLTARKGPLDPRTLESFLIPGLASARDRLVAGWGDAMRGNWIPVEASSKARLRVPEGSRRRFYFVFYLWPSGPFPAGVTIEAAGRPLAARTIDSGGDCTIECDVPDSCGPGLHEVAIRFDPPPAEPPAVRSLGFYVPA